eukprot:scaffold99497_cov19-Prasinocladus_malaysianus.AAC.1
MQLFCKTAAEAVIEIHHNVMDAKFSRVIEKLQKTGEDAIEYLRFMMMPMSAVGAALNLAMRERGMTMREARLIETVLGKQLSQQDGTNCQCRETAVETFCDIHLVNNQLLKYSFGTVQNGTLGGSN